MLKSIRLKNFKAYKDSGEVPLAPLTVIVGANNSGKSTLFHALLALVQTARDSEQGWGPRLVTKGLVDLNGYDDIVHGRSQTDSPSFEISVRLDTDAASPQTNTGNGARVVFADRANISFGLDDELGEIAVEASELRSGEKPVIAVKRNPSGGWSLATAPPGSPQRAHIDFRSVFPCLEMPKEDRPSKAYMNAVQTANSTASFWKEIFAKQISHISPLRVRVPWQASVGARTSSEPRGGENLLADLGSKEKDRKGRTRLELVNEWLAKRKILKNIHSYKLGGRSENVRTLRGDEWDGFNNINIAGMGEGISQLLPIVAYSLFGAKDDCVIVEQPEIHLHPALQAELGDLFIDVAQTGQRQVLVETHSEHLVLRVRRRVAEGKLKPDQVAILFVEKHGGKSKVRRLDLNSRGHFSDWPKGFFDEAYQEAMALATAASKKG